MTLSRPGASWEDELDPAPPSAEQMAEQEAILADQIAAGWPGLPPGELMDFRPDPDGGPPGGEHAWLGELPGRVLAAVPAEQGTARVARAGPSALDDVVAHDGLGPGGPGFESGSALPRPRQTHRPKSRYPVVPDPHERRRARGRARLRPPAAAPGHRPARISAWLARLKPGPIEAGTCTHAREVPGYRIPDSLHHIVKVRQQTCCNPICARPAQACDDDHTRPHDQGGRTCECGLAPACRTCHRTKQAPGWHLEQPSPGVLVWQPPHGRRYTIGPGVYPRMTRRVGPASRPAAAPAPHDAPGGPGDTAGPGASSTRASGPCWGPASSSPACRSWPCSS